MKKYIAIGALALIFLTFLLLSFNKSSIEYTDFQTAKELNKKVQVVGTLEKNLPFQYNPSSNLFEFYMKDKKGKVMLVRFNGPQPNNFTIAPEFVVKGTLQDTFFLASEIITKCPSKYEGEVEHLKK
ncbi:cytochrome c maturation protein CcmE [Bacteroidetes/Chlorobi group bacterium Naka2016]|jgi:cytochrome c-type biogenesis protein CcmE|nr:MAG: cytochrome c maturation protein CcmE [Bacteroidetes/Chlorobi group bacterium Naka2016]